MTGPPAPLKFPLFRRAPLLPVALALIAGLVAGFHLPMAWWLWAALVVAGLALSIRWDGALLLSTVALGGWLAPSPPQGPLPVLDRTQQHLITGVVRQVHQASDRTQFTVQFLAGLPDSVAARRGLWRIYHMRRLPTRQEQALLPGDTVLVQGRLARPRGRRNPNGFDYRFYLWGRGIDLLIREPAQLLRVAPRQGLHVARAATVLRRRITARLDQWVGQPQAGLGVGLLLGDRGGIDEDFRRRMTDLGVGHILAVSGLHVGYIALILFAVARVLPLRRYGRLAVVSLGLLAYVLLTGAPPSVVRAAIMAFLFAWGTTLERPPSPWNLLGAAAIISVLIDPRVLFTASFQLSFAAVAGILHIGLRLRAWLRASPAGERLYRWRAARWGLDLALVSLGAQLGTLPVTLTLFHSFSIYALLANLFVVPLAGFAVLGGTLFLAGMAVWQPLGAIWAETLWLILSGLQGAVGLLSRLPQPQMIVGRPGALAVALILAGVAAFPFLFKPGPARLRLRLAAAVLVLANLFIWNGVFADRDLRVTFIDVGQGDAIHLALPDGRHLLVDAGAKSPGFDVGERVVWPYLKGQGIGRLYIAAISHPQADHMGGLPSLLRRLAIEEIWDSPHLVSNRMVRRVQQLADSLDVPIRRLQAGDFLRLGAVDIMVLSPDSVAARSDNTNNASLVLLLRYGERTLLLTGDAERPVERRLLSYGEVLRSDWLKVGHHGSATSSTVAFLKAARPKGAVVSVGRGNLYRHPSPEVLDRLHEVAPVVHRTDTQGALVLRT
ncbi:MAG: DNA internalization-related competence protein ComEC/Rec2, partial [Candidatus Neomarinimicrobiota bacterium]